MERISKRYDCKVIPSSNLKRDYGLMLLMFCVSGNQAFTSPDRAEIVLVSFLLILVFYTFMKGLQSINSRFTLISVVFFGLFLYQGFDFMFFPIETVFGFYVRLMIAFLLAYIVEDFPETYCKVLYYISCVGLIIYMLDQISLSIGFPFRELTQPLQNLVGVENYYTVITRVNIGIHNFQEIYPSNRNSSFFTEAGMFAGYLIIGIALLSACKNSIGNYWKILSIYILALLSTMSTMGYLLLPLALLFHVHLIRTNKRTMYMSLAAIMFVAFCILLAAVEVQKLSFMVDKISYLWSSGLNKGGHNWNLSRFGNALFDWEYIKEKPLTGWGMHTSTRYQLNPGLDILIMGNGLTDTIAKFGFIGFITMMYCMFKGSNKLWGKTQKAGLFVVLFMLVMFGEPFLNYPMGMALMFLGVKICPSPLKSQGEKGDVLG